MAIAAGLWVGGKKPVVLIQNTGIFESGDSIRGLGLDINQPLVMLIGYRGWTRRGVTPDSAARFIEPILHTWGINCYLIETDDDADRISLACEEAETHPEARGRPGRYRIRRLANYLKTWFDRLDAALRQAQGERS